MSRLLKRVPLNFNHPLNQIWIGYINPYIPNECKECDETGYNKETREIEEMWYNLNGKYDNTWCYNLTQDDINALLEQDRLWDFTRIPINEKQRKDVEEKVKNGGNSWLPYNNGYKPTPEEVNEWNKNTIFGLSSIARYICVEAKAKREGVYGFCENCEGRGYTFYSKEHERKYDNWEPFEPPVGDGYQLWEDTSEGSPISPVFSNLDELCEWASKNATTFGSNTTTADEWKKMLNEEFVYHQEGNFIFI